MTLDYRPPVKNPSAPRKALREAIGVAGLVMICAALYFPGALTGGGGSHQPAPKTQARAEMMGLSTALQAYYSVYSRYPTTSEGLQALTTAKPPFWIGPVRKDPWGNAYRYISPAGGEKGYRISSDGPDGVAGTADDLIAR